MLGDPLGFMVGSCAPLDLGAVLCKEVEKLLLGQAEHRAVLSFAVSSCCRCQMLLEKGQSAYNRSLGE